MAYILSSDVESIIYSEELDVLQQADEKKFTKAEAATVDYFKGYLRTRYDVDTLFTDYTEGDDDERPAALVMKMCQYLLCLLYQTQPDRMIPEHRQDACDKVQEWLEAINDGTIDPGFPTVDTDDEEDTLNPIQFKSNRKVSGTW